MNFIFDDSTDSSEFTDKSSRQFNAILGSSTGSAGYTDPTFASNTDGYTFDANT